MSLHCFVRQKSTHRNKTKLKILMIAFFSFFKYFFKYFTAFFVFCKQYHLYLQYVAREQMESQLLILGTPHCTKSCFNWSENQSSERSARTVCHRDERPAVNHTIMFIRVSEEQQLHTPSTLPAGLTNTPWLNASAGILPPQNHPLTWFHKLYLIYSKNNNIVKYIAFEIKCLFKLFQTFDCYILFRSRKWCHFIGLLTWANYIFSTNDQWVV